MKWVTTSGALSFVLASTALALQGCASMVHGTTQKLTIQSDPPGAHVTVVPSGVTGTTPTTATLKRKQVHTIHFDLDGYKSVNVLVHRDYSDAINGNLLLGGLLGMVADVESGGAFALTPDPVKVKLEPLTRPSPRASDSLPEAASD